MSYRGVTAQPVPETWQGAKAVGSTGCDGTERLAPSQG